MNGNNTQLICYKGIQHLNVTDAPFVTAVICAIMCNINCKGCHNSHLRDLPILTIRVKELIQEVIDKGNEGITLGGLEWTCQPMEMRYIINEAHRARLKTMLYTGLDIFEFTSRFPDLWEEDKLDYIKAGKYIADDKSVIRGGIRLASSNQLIFNLR